MLKLEIAKQESDYLMEKSQEAVRAKNEFLENMSHELRTPLNTIIGYTELLLDNEMSSEQNNEFTQIILSSSKKLTGMVDDLLTMSRIEFGEIRFYPTLINLPKLIADVKLPFYDSVAEKKLNIKIMVDPDLKLIKTDPSKLRQMLSCYLSNAIKFSHPEGKIEIRAFSIKNDEFRIEVEDQGIGVNKENLDKLFVLFSQQDMSKSKKYQGMGLGLALTRRIAEAQGGKVGVQSELNKGSIFYIILLNSAPQKINHQKANHSAEFSIES
jgi:signal transduction histidine kinase